MTKNNVFVKITNTDIYNKLVGIETKIGRMNTKINVNSAIIGVIIIILVAILS